MIIGWMLAVGLSAADPMQAAPIPDFDLRCVTVNSADVIRLQVGVDGGRIRFPATRKLGAVGKTPKDSWFALSGLSVEADQITARFKLGWLATPRLRVDRTTGGIEIMGADDVRFSGMCEPYAASTPERRF